MHSELSFSPPRSRITYGSAQTTGDAAVEARLATEPTNLQPGDVATLRFALIDGGRPVENFERHHGRKLHVVLISEDMQVFGHVHPQDFGKSITDGEAEVRFAFPRAGRYLASADALTQAGPYSVKFMLEVAAPTPSRLPPVSAHASLVVVEAAEGDIHTAPVLLDAAGPTLGYEVSVSRPANIRAREPTTFTWRLTREGIPITDLRLFLEAAMHLAVVKDDLGHFLHGHGVAKGIDTGYDHVHGSGGDTGAAGDGPEVLYFGPEITATVTFPEPGRYYLFGQSAHGNKLLISRISVDVDA